MALLAYIRVVAETSATAEPLSPAKSALAVLAGFVVLWVLRILFLMTAGALFPSLYPAEEGAHPTTNGLVLSLVGELINATLAGLVVGRLAGRAPIAHAGILAGLCGFFALTSMDQVIGFPGWFAIGFAVTAPIGLLVGGLIASRVRART